MRILLSYWLILLLTAINGRAEAQMTAGQIDSMKQQLTQAREDTNQVNLLMNLGNETGYTSLSEALNYATRGYRLAQKLHFTSGIGNLAYLTSITYMDLGNYAAADSFMTIAQSSFRQLNDTRRLAKCDNALGSRHYMTGNYLLAADAYSRASETFERLGDPANALVAYQNLISVLGEINQHEKAAELGKRALALAERIHDSLSVGYALQNLVVDLIYADHLPEAAAYLPRLLRYEASNRDQNLSAEISSTVGTYFYHTGDFRQARQYFEKALAAASRLDNRYQVANHYNALGQALYRLGQWDQARTSLQTGLEWARKYGNKRAESNLALSMSSLEDSAGNIREAYRYLQLHRKIADSILNADTRNTTAQLETRFETNKKETEILRLQQLQQEKDFELNRRNTWLAGGLGLILLLIAILYLLRRNYHNRQNLARQQAALLEEKISNMEKEQQISSLQAMINGQESERTRIARDLHDGLGGLFSTVKMHYSTLEQDTPAIRENPLYRKTLDLINSASEELRKVAHNMMPEVLMKVGLVEALNDLCHAVSSGKLLRVVLQTYGMETRLGASTEIMLYRIIQELINNIIKHASATEAIVQINREGRRLSVVIEDNGRGFDTREAEAKKTMGMATIKSRVDYLNGKLSIDSRKNIGTTVLIDLLLNDGPEST